MQIPPSVNPKIYALSAFIVGFLLSNDFEPIEKLSIAAWLGLVAETLGTITTQELVIVQRTSGGSVDPLTGQTTGGNQNTAEQNNNNGDNMRFDYKNVRLEKQELEFVKQTLDKLQQKVDEIIRESK